MAIATAPGLGTKAQRLQLLDRLLPEALRTPGSALHRNARVISASAVLAALFAPIFIVLVSRLGVPELTRILCASFAVGITRYLNELADI